jgi:hypothetical protein
MNITRCNALQLPSAGALASAISPRSLFADTRKTARSIAKLHLCDRNKIVEVKRFLGADSELAWMFENCSPNTLDRTVRTAYINGKLSAII